MIQAFVCTHCPLAFEIGWYSYWDFEGDTGRLVCVRCGTMHRLDFLKKSASDSDETGTTTYLALPEPVRKVSRVFKETILGDRFQDYEWPFGEDDWLTVSTWSGRRPFTELSCNRCGEHGTLISLGLPKTSEGLWPVFRQHDNTYLCPLCSNPIGMIYDETIN